MFSKVSKSFDLKKARSIELIVNYHNKTYPSNAGLLLFSKDIQKYFPDAVIRCGSFAGITKSNIIDQQDIVAPLPNTTDPIISFIERNTSIRSDIGRTHRQDIPQYPPLVLREAVINAVVHADYSRRGSNIQVAIFSDRIEITNPGALPFGLSMEKALTGVSQLRNRIVGSIFRELGLIEKWGSGLNRMIDISRDAGLKDPFFEEVDNYFRVTLYHSQVSKKSYTALHELIINHIKAKGEIDTITASKLWAVTTRTAAIRLQKMRGEGLLNEISTGPFDPKKKYILSE